MENSETQEKVIALGKKLAKNFEELESGDTLSQWMAHYIAEKIIKAESHEGTDKLSASEDCFETVLKLWHHQAYFPRGARPFEQFDDILSTIERLDPDNKTPFYYRETESEVPRISDEAEIWIKVVKGLDHITRILIEFSLEQALRSTVDEKTIDWLTTLSGITKTGEIIIVQQFISELNVESDEEKVQKQREQRLNKLNDRMEQLEVLENLCELIKSEIQQQLNSIS